MNKNYINKKYMIVITVTIMYFFSGIMHHKSSDETVWCYKFVGNGRDRSLHIVFCILLQRVSVPQFRYIHKGKKCLFVAGL
jgi:hypothetical protein